MGDISYLEIDEVIAIHEDVVTKFGGQTPIHNFALLHSAVFQPRATFGGHDLYPSLFEKAAVLISSLILNHPFDDGYKRTAIVSCARFLYVNGWYLQLPIKESIQFTLDIDAKRLDFEKIVLWLQKNSQQS